MDDISRLFGLSFCMLVGCYVAGAIPLAFTMSEVKIEKLCVVYYLFFYGSLLYAMAL